MRVAFLIDGFNLYHSIRDAEKAHPGPPQRWLDLRAFCQEYIRHFGPAATLSGIHYFSAYARHLEAHKVDVVRRHETYVDALRSTGVDVVLSSFKSSEKYIPLKFCSFRVWPLRRRFRLPIPRATVIVRRTEEKETDVAIASKLFELLHLGAADAVLLVSGDTDLIPAIRTARRLFPAAQVCVVFPFKRHNAELKAAVRRSFKARREQYARHQLPHRIVLPNGHVIEKPSSW